jgi:hypothetical protein
MSCSGFEPYLGRVSSAETVPGQSQKESQNGRGTAPSPIARAEI